ncbi:hypothetical protein D9M70_198920 [compost metagenome]
MNEMHPKHTDYVAAYALFNLPMQQEPRWDQDPMHFKKVSLLTDANVSYSANSASAPVAEAPKP